MLKPMRQWIFSIIFIVVVRAMWFFTLIPMKTLLYFEIVWMEFLFFPAMTVRASVLILASIFIRCDETFCMPILAHIFWIVEYWRFSSVILPVMSIHTNISLMIIFTIGTPYSLKMKQIEIHIWLEFFY